MTSVYGEKRYEVNNPCHSCEHNLPDYELNVDWCLKEATLNEFVYPDEKGICKEYSPEKLKEIANSK